MFGQEVTQEFVLSNRLLSVVRDRQQAQPISHEVGGVFRVALDKGGLELDNLAYGSYGVVASVVVHCKLFLLALDFGSDRELNAASKRLKTEV